MTRRRLRVLAIVTVVVGSGSALFSLQQEAQPGLATIAAALGGALTGFTIGLLEIFLRGPGAQALHRLPLLPVMMLRTALYGAIIGAAPRIVVALLQPLLSPIPESPGNLTAPGILFAVVMSLGINFLFILRALLGPRMLAALVTGRYHRPRREERILLFLDLQDSTTLAERLGDKEFHGFLNRVFFDISEPVLEAGGEIYRYVGDEIIVTWTLGRGVRNAACVSCLFGIVETLARRSPAYVAAFGAAPRLRGALHAGPLIVGEMGDIKREIVFLGDTMNTASRIEGACRSTGHDFIISGPLLAALPMLPKGVRSAALGPIPLRGKEAGIELYALMPG